jgi:hypothetical protein
MLDARIKFFAQKAGNPDKSPCWMPDQVGTFGATMEQVSLTSRFLKRGVRFNSRSSRRHGVSSR